MGSDSHYNDYIQEVNQLLNTALPETPEIVDDILGLKEPIRKLSEAMFNIFLPFGKRTFYVHEGSIPGEDFKGNLFYCVKPAFTEHGLIYADSIDFGICGENRFIATNEGYGLKLNCHVYKRKKLFSVEESLVSGIIVPHITNLYFSNGRSYSINQFLTALKERVISNSPDKDKYLEYTEMIFRFPGLIEKAHRLRNEQQDVVSSEVDGLLSRVRAAILEDDHEV